MATCQPVTVYGPSEPGNTLPLSIPPVGPIEIGIRVAGGRCASTGYSAPGHCSDNSLTCTFDCEFELEFVIRSPGGPWLRVQSLERLGTRHLWLQIVHLTHATGAKWQIGGSSPQHWPKWKGPGCNQGQHTGHSSGFRVDVTGSAACPGECSEEWEAELLPGSTLSTSVTLTCLCTELGNH
jgi:hypothetical protein